MKKKDEVVPIKKKKTIKEEIRKEHKVKTTFPIQSLAIILGFVALFGVASYFLFGKLLAMVLVIGLIFVLFIGFLLDKPKKKGKRQKIIKILLIIFLSGTILVLLAGCGFMYYVVKNAPDFKQELLKEKEATILYDSDGNQFAKLGSEVRENIEYDEISEAFIDALIATEDSRFFQHSGFDLMRFLKAAFGQALGQDAGGGSTLTMQLSKNTFTDKNDKGFAGIVRKFTDIYISIFQIERNYTKEQIIEFYANNHNLSGIIFGVQEASRHFFNKDAKDLTVSEAAVIAGMYQAPSSYNPFNHPQAATKRRKNVLYYMERHGYITKEERAYAESIPVESLLTDSSKSTNVYQGYIDLVCKEVQEKYGVDPYSIPMLVYTNMLRSNQDGINTIMNNPSTGTFWWKDDAMQAGIAVVDSTSGKILAIGAGRNRTGAKSYSYATDINRQIGSSAKPLFDYGPGMEYNNWSTYTLFQDEPYTYSNGKAIHNYDDKYYQHGVNGLMTLREALANSYNVPALKAFQSVDNKKIIEFVTAVGITPEISNGYIHEAHAIGAFTGSNPLSMAGAYQMFSNGGYYYEPYSVSKIIFRDSSNGDPIEKTSAKTKVISDSTAYMISDILKGASTTWEVRGGLGNDYFGVKTGTTNLDSAIKKSKGLPDYAIRDYWIMGYTHNVVIGIWIGYDELSPEHFLDYNNDGKYRNRLLNEVAKVSFKHDKIDFTKPGSVVQSAVEFGSDPPKLPSEETPSDQIRYEYFKRGTEPSEVSTKYMGAEAPTGLTFKSTTTSVTLSWNKVKNPEYIDNATFGYQIYFKPEGTNDWYLLGFTTSLTFKFTGTANGKTFDSFYGTYHVHGAYEGTTDSRGKPAEYIYEKDRYDLTVDENDVTFNVGDTVPAKYYNGKLISLVKNGSSVSFTITNTLIRNKANEVVTKIETTQEETYTITYTISYTANGEKVTKECSNIVRIKAKDEANNNDDNNTNTDNNNSNDNNNNNQNDGNN